MSRQLQKIDFQRDWGGLVRRTQELDYGAGMASEARNVEYYGGAVGKRLGTQFLNGWGSRVLVAWVGTSTGDVEDGSGFVNTDVLDFYHPDGTIDLAEAVDTVVTNTITLSGTVTKAPVAGTVVIARRPLATTNRIDGLHQANFKDGTVKRLAACGSGIFELPALGTTLGGTLVTEDFPVTTVDLLWGGTSTGTLTSVEGLEVGDRIVIAGVGAGGSDLDTTITSVTPSTRTIVISPVATSAPDTPDVVTFFPTRVPGDTHFLQYANMTHIFSDTTPPVKYIDDGGYVLQRHGIKAPTFSSVIPTTVVGGVGNLTGTYRYRVKFENPGTGAESEASPPWTSAALTADEGSILNLPVSVDPQCTKKSLYRTLPDSEGVYYFAEQLDNSTVNHTDDIADIALGSQMREFLDNPIPDKGSIVAAWPQANRLLAINGDTGDVLFSDQPDLEDGTLKGESWPLANALLINFEDGDNPRALGAFYDSVVIGKERSLFRLQGLPPNLVLQALIFRPDLSGVGMFSQKAVAIDQNEMMFPAEDGVYLMSRHEADVQGFQSRRLSRSIDDVFTGLSTAHVQKAHAVFFRERRQYRIFLPTGIVTEPDEGFVFQFEGNISGEPYGWSNWTFNEGLDTGIKITASAVGKDTPDIVMIGTDDGAVLLMDQGAAERGGFEYTFQYATTHFAPAGKGIPARGRVVDVTPAVITDINLDVEVETDFTGPDKAVTLVLESKLPFIFDTSMLDVDELGALVSGAIPARAILIALGEYHRIRFREMSATGRFNLQNFGYWFQALPQQTKRPTALQMRT